MFDAIEKWFNTANNSKFMENMSNEKFMDLITSPIGLGVSAVLVAFFVLLKWRLSAVVLTAILAGIYIFRYTLTETGAPNSSIYLFIAGAVGV